MPDRPTPQIYLRQNPWSKVIGNGVVLQKLQTAAVLCERTIQRWIDNDELDANKAFALVILDPTRPRWQQQVQQRVLAVVLFGDAEMAKGYLPNGLAKVDLHDRHGTCSGDIIDSAIFCLGNDDFTWGSSANFMGAIAGGSGFTVIQDEKMAQTFLLSFVPGVADELARWVQEQRRSRRGSWMNSDNQPSVDYLIDLGDGHWITPSV